MKRKLSSGPAFDILRSTLRQRRLPQEEVVRLATDLLQHSPQRMSSGLFSILSRDPTEMITGNLLAVFRDLAERSPQWVRILEKSVRKRGRCPAQLRSALRSALDIRRQHVASEARSLRDALSLLDTDPLLLRSVHGASVRRDFRRFPFTKSTAHVKMTTSLTEIWQMEATARLCRDLDPPPDDLVVDCEDVEHLYIVGLAALNAWCLTHSVPARIVNASLRTNEYLRYMGFADSLDGRDSPAQADPTFAMAVERITPKTRPEDIATRLATIVDARMSIPAAARISLSVLFAELIENISRHSGLRGTALACAQVYPKRNFLAICIVDTGIGVRRSILHGTNFELRQRVQHGESALQIACAPLATSKPDEHSGYGLYVASELAVRNGGVFRIYSGNEILTLSRNKWRRKHHLSTSAVPWEGTWIAMLIDLDGTISVQDVYLTLPLADWATEEDYF